MKIHTTIKYDNSNKYLFVCFVLFTFGSKGFNNPPSLSNKPGCTYMNLSRIGKESDFVDCGCNSRSKKSLAPHLNQKNLSINSSWYFDHVLDTMDSPELAYRVLHIYGPGPNDSPFLSQLTQEIVIYLFRKL